jgi:hypothetical protein
VLRSWARWGDLPELTASTTACVRFRALDSEAFPEAGLTTKIHLLANESVLPVVFGITAGQVADCTRQ